MGRFTAVLALLALFACRSPTPSELIVTGTDRPVGGHLPPEQAISLKTSAGEKLISKSAYFAALGPDERVAWVAQDGIHLWNRGEDVRVARAQPRGLGAGPAGVVFASSAEKGQGSGVALMSWSGEVRVLIEAPEDLPGPAGYHQPAISPEGRYVVAFSDLTPRPSIHRVDLTSGAVVQLSDDAPPVVGAPRWREGLLIWSTGDGEAALHVESGEVSVR